MPDNKRKKHLTIMLVPHSGKSIKSIELTFSFFIGCGIGLLAIVAASVFFTFKYVDSKSLLESNIAYITEREDTLNKISEELKNIEEISDLFSDELDKSQALFSNASASTRSPSEGLMQQGDFEQALDFEIQKFSDNQEVESLLSLSQKLQQNLPILENMNSLVASQKELFKDLPVYWPVKGGLVSMEWGPNIHPVYGSWYIHKGIDLAAWNGTPVYSSGNGEVTFIGYDVGYGLHIYVTHKYGFKTHYSHLSAIKVRKGQKVEQGQLIGNVGVTGLVTGPHLDYQLYLGNELVDPGVYLRIFNTYTRPKGNR